MFHKHNFGPWKQEHREHIYETEESRLVDKVLFNVRTCQGDGCGFVQSRKGDR